VLREPSKPTPEVKSVSAPHRENTKDRDGERVKPKAERDRSMRAYGRNPRALGTNPREARP
jgi:hypothetical protein